MDHGQQVLESGRAHRRLSDAVGRRLELLGACLRLAAALDVQRSEHGRAEAMQVVFHDVVGRTQLQILHRGLVSQSPGHDDHWCSRRELLRDLQRVTRAEGRE